MVELLECVQSDKNVGLVSDMLCYSVVLTGTGLTYVWFFVLYKVDNMFGVTVKFTLNSKGSFSNVILNSQ